jgi:ABC-type Na+ transport system ATPase subunit NatA
MNKGILIAIIAGIISLSAGATGLYVHLKKKEMIKKFSKETGISFEEAKARLTGFEKRIKELEKNNANEDVILAAFEEFNRNIQKQN